jgi:hypothetical protein
METDMSVKIDFGEFYDERYEKKTAGAAMVLAFEPNVSACKTLINSGTDVMEFHLIQIVKETPDGTQPPPGIKQGNEGYGVRRSTSGWAVDIDWQAALDGGYKAIAGARKKELEDNSNNWDFKWQLDIDNAKEKQRSAGTVLTSLDPRYAQQRIAPSIPLFTIKTEQTNGNALVLQPPDYKWPRDFHGSGVVKRASLRDAPSVPLLSDVIGMGFEVAVLLDFVTNDVRHSRYLGSVKWGWTRSSGKSDTTLQPLAPVHKSGVSDQFSEAVKHWNGLTVADPAALNGAGPHAVMKLPEQ